MVDSQAKLRADDARRQPFSAASFVVGICIGLIVTQLGYVVWHAGSSSPAPNTLRSRSLAAASFDGSSVSKAAIKNTGSSSPLASILQQVAPQKEVLVAISNYRLVEGNMLPMWLEVSIQSE